VTLPDPLCKIDLEARVRVVVKWAGDLEDDPALVPKAGQEASVEIAGVYFVEVKRHFPSSPPRTRKVIRFSLPGEARPALEA